LAEKGLNDGEIKDMNGALCQVIITEIIFNLEQKVEARIIGKETA